MLGALAALPPSLLAPTQLLPVAVAESKDHQLLQRGFRLGLEAQEETTRASEASVSFPVEELLRFGIYFHPLTRRLTPKEFSALLAVTGARPLLLFTYAAPGVASNGEARVALFVIQNIPHLTALPRVYETMYSNFLSAQ